MEKLTSNIVLYSVLIIVMIVVITIVKFFTGRSENNFFDDEKKPLPFYLKKNIMNSSEQALFINLNKQLGSEYIILSKVRTEDFIGVDKNSGLPRNEIFGLRGRIKSRHVDFLICDSNGMKPLMVVELDGKSHDRDKRKERDEYLDRVYTDVGLRYVHVRVGSNFEKEAEEIKNLINNV